MKIKVRPEDFVVRETSDLPLSAEPRRFAVFTLAKRQWDTFDLVDYLARRLRVERRDIGLGGIKDRYGDTEQLISIRAEGRRLPDLSASGFTLRLQGYAEEPLTARAVAGNRFTIVVRDIDPHLTERYRQALESLRDGGLPNYYDEQRFGSARHGQGFMGKELFLRHREEALRLYFTPSRHDDRRTRELKSCVTRDWGRWDGCLPLAFGDYRPVLEYLAAHRRSFTEALGRLDRRFLVFVLNAYQSFLFNEILSGYLLSLARTHGIALLSRSYRHGAFLYPESLPSALLATLREVRLPVPGHDSEIRDGTVQAIAAGVLEREGIGWDDLRVRQLSRVQVHGVERAMLAFPQGLTISEAAGDELYPGRDRLTLEFGLPRGSYATLLLKRLEAVPAA
jgi:tRNA pseudouridine13 synthase